MARLSFEELPPYSWPGGTISGTVVLEADKPLRGTNLTLRLEGREIAQVTVQAGKSSERLVEQVAFLEQEYDVRQALLHVDPIHVMPGVYRAPFEFVIPSTAPPSIHTKPHVPGGGVLDTRPDGLYVEYVLEARLEVPMWTDLVARAPVPIFSPRRVLGVLPALQSPANPGHPSISLDLPSPVPVLPGGTLQAPYSIQNPGGKRLRSVQLDLTRIVEYRARGRPGLSKAPAFVAQAPIGGKEPSYSGEIELPLPNNDDMTGPGQGQTFVTFWVARLVLDVELGLNVVVEVPLAPG